MRGPNNYPYTDEEWWLRSEVPDNPERFVFGLPEVWEGFMDDDGEIWSEIERV